MTSPRSAAALSNPYDDPDIMGFMQHLGISNPTAATSPPVTPSRMVISPPRVAPKELDRSQMASKMTKSASYQNPPASSRGGEEERARVIEERQRALSYDKISKARAALPQFPLCEANRTAEKLAMQGQRRIEATKAKMTSRLTAEEAANQRETDKQIRGEIASSMRQVSQEHAAKTEAQNSNAQVEDSFSQSDAQIILDDALNRAADAKIAQEQRLAKATADHLAAEGKRLTEQQRLQDEATATVQAARVRRAKASGVAREGDTSCEPPPVSASLGHSTHSIAIVNRPTVYAPAQASTKMSTDSPSPRMSALASVGGSIPLTAEQFAQRAYKGTLNPLLNPMKAVLDASTSVRDTPPLLGIFIDIPARNLRNDDLEANTLQQCPYPNPNPNPQP